MLGILITDNIIVAYEALHSMKIRHRGYKGSMVIKLDISKVYDKMEWSFLEEMMWKFRFNEMWISRVMRYVTTVTYSTLFNCQLGPIIKPTRGLCQGDLISHYLYLLCAEGPSQLLHEAEKAKLIRGLEWLKVALR